MKKVVFFIVAIICSPYLRALNGICYTIGKSPQATYNYQTKYFIECEHDCPKTMHQCLECGHFHDIETQTIIDQNTPQKQITKYIKRPTTPQEASAYITQQARLLLLRQK